MKIKIKENSITADALKAKLEEQFQGKYEIKNRGPKMLVVSKSNIIGTTILVRKNSLIVNGNFSTMGSQFIFAISVVLLGVLIPIIIYFAAFHGKMKEVEKEVAGFINEEYMEETSGI